jgi:hypothetical protein
MTDELTERVTVRMDGELMELLRRAVQVWPGLTPSQLIRDLIYEQSGRLRQMVQAHEDMTSGDPEREARGVKLSAALHESARLAQIQLERMR